MSMHYQLDKPAIHRSLQEWVCNACGGRDHKSCGCNSEAHAEELAAKKEANRQASRRSYEKAKQNQRPSNDETSVENIEDFPSASAQVRKAEYEEDSEPDLRPFPKKIAKANQRGFFLMNCHASIQVAEYEGPIDDEIRIACRRAADAWNRLAAKLGG